MEEIDIIEYTPLIAPGEFTIGTIDMLQTILLVIAGELIVVQEAPSEGADNVDSVFVNALQCLAQEPLVVQGPLQVVQLSDGSLGELHERIETEFTESKES